MDTVYMLYVMKCTLVNITVSAVYFTTDSHTSDHLTEKATSNQLAITILYIPSYSYTPNSTILFDNEEFVSRHF